MRRCGWIGGKMAHKKADLDLLQPVFRFRVERILADLEALGWQPIVHSTMRTSAEEAEKVREGRSRTMRSWHVASTFAMLPDGRGRYYVVNGNAADIIDRRYAWHGPAGNPEFQFWKDLGRIARRYGCEWGGDWKKFRDVAHVQMLFIDQRPRCFAFA